MRVEYVAIPCLALGLTALVLRFRSAQVAAPAPQDISPEVPGEEDHLVDETIVNVEDTTPNAEVVALEGTAAAIGLTADALFVGTTLKYAADQVAERTAREAAERASKEAAEKAAREAAERTAREAAERAAKEAAEKAAKEAAETAAKKAAKTATKVGVKSAARAGLVSIGAAVPFLGWALAGADAASRAYDPEDGSIDVQNIVDSYQSDFGALWDYGQLWVSDPGQASQATQDAFTDMGNEIVSGVNTFVEDVVDKAGNVGKAIESGAKDVAGFFGIRW